MKAIQITIDEELLRRLERDPEVKRAGRSAVFREAVREWLRRRRHSSIAAAYKRGYATKPTELSGWAGAEAWPEE